jgi:hypothetical protein
MIPFRQIIWLSPKRCRTFSKYSIGLNYCAGNCQKVDEVADPSCAMSPSTQSLYRMISDAGNRPVLQTVCYDRPCSKSSCFRQKSCHRAQLIAPPSITFTNLTSKSLFGRYSFSRQYILFLQHYSVVVERIAVDQFVLFLGSFSFCSSAACLYFARHSLLRQFRWWPLYMLSHLSSIAINYATFLVREVWTFFSALVSEIFRECNLLETIMVYIQVSLLPLILRLIIGPFVWNAIIRSKMAIKHWCDIWVYRPPLSPSLAKYVLKTVHFLLNLGLRILKPGRFLTFELVQAFQLSPMGVSQHAAHFRLSISMLTCVSKVFRPLNSPIADSYYQSPSLWRALLSWLLSTDQSLFRVSCNDSQSWVFVLHPVRVVLRSLFLLLSQLWSFAIASCSDAMWAKWALGHLGLHRMLRISPKVSLLCQKVNIRDSVMAIAGSAFTYTHIAFLTGHDCTICGSLVNQWNTVVLRHRDQSSDERSRDWGKCGWRCWIPSRFEFCNCRFQNDTTARDDREMRVTVSERFGCFGICLPAGKWGTLNEISKIRVSLGVNAFWLSVLKFTIINRGAFQRSRKQ